MYRFVPTTVATNPRYKQATFDEHLLISIAKSGSRPPEPPPLWHLDGVDWFDADPPSRWHTHWAQTVGNFPDLGGEMWRCACGAHGGPLVPWVQLGKARVAPSAWRRLLRLGPSGDA